MKWFNFNDIYQISAKYSRNISNRSPSLMYLYQLHTNAHIRYKTSSKLLFVYTFHFFFPEPSNDWVLSNLYSSIYKITIHVKVKICSLPNIYFFQANSFSFYTTQTYLVLKQENGTCDNSFL